MTLKQFFNHNKEQLSADLAKQTGELREELEALRVLNLVVTEITIGQLS